MGSDHLPIEISINAPRNSSVNHTKYKFDQTDREVLESTLEAALGSKDFSGQKSTSDLDKYADFIVSVISTAVNRAIRKAKSVQSESNPFSNEPLALIKEKRRFRRQYSQIKDPTVKTRINQLQKQVKEKLRVEMQDSWEKFCNSISLESDPQASLGAKSRTSLSLRVSVAIQHCATMTKSPRQMPIKYNSLPNWSKDTSANILIRISLIKSTSL